MTRDPLYNLAHMDKDKWLSGKIKIKKTKREKTYREREKIVSNVCKKEIVRKQNWSCNTEAVWWLVVNKEWCADSTAAKQQSVSHHQPLETKKTTHTRQPTTPTKVSIESCHSMLCVLLLFGKQVYRSMKLYLKKPVFIENYRKF